MKIETLTITKIFINHESKTGEKFVSAKTGKKFWKIAIQVDEQDYKGEYLTDLIFEETDERFEWKTGQMINVIVSRNNQYLNFKLPKQIDYLEMRIEALENLLNSGKLQTKKDTPILGVEEDSEIPF